MTRLNWISGFTAAVMFAVLSSTGVARAQDTSSDTLVRTTCKLGYLTECGTVNIGTQCSTTWSGNINLILRSAGFNLGEKKCAGNEQYAVFKDYDRNKTDFGVCYSVPTAQRDATATSPGSMDGEDIEDSPSEC
jgi:hypothetical protein